MTKEEYLEDPRHWPEMFRILAEEIAAEVLARRTDIAAKPDEHQWERARRAAAVRLNAESSVAESHIQIEADDLIPCEKHAYTYFKICYRLKRFKITFPLEAELVAAAQE